MPLVAAAQTCCGCAIAGDIDEHVLRQAAANGRHLHAAHAHAARDGAPYLALGDLAAANGRHLHAAHAHAARDGAPYLALGDLDSISERRGLAPPETTPPPPATALPAPLSAAELAWHAANRPIRCRSGTAQAGGVLPCIWSAHLIASLIAC